jgi:hypothetical protein
VQEAQRLVAENPSQAHLQTLSYVWLRQGKSWDRLLADARALNTAPENKALLSELIDALTDSRVNTPRAPAFTKRDAAPRGASPS